MPELFPAVARTDDSPKRHAESSYDFLCRSARFEIGTIRSVLNDWFDAYPVLHQADLRTRIAADFDTAFFELLLHEYFKRHGFVLTQHPAMADTTKTPDFLVEKGSCRFYLEATIARDSSAKETAHSNVEARIYDAINEIPSPNFFVRLLRVEIKPGHQPSTNRLKAFLVRELGKHNPDEVAASVGANPIADGPRLLYNDVGLELDIVLIPRSPGARGRPDKRTIGIYPFQTQVGGCSESIRKSIESKATRYGDPDLPYIVAVNSLSDMGVDDDDVLDALFGSEQFTWTRDSDTVLPSRATDGPLMGPRGAMNTRVSAILVGHVFPSNLADCRLELYHNPWAKRPLAACEVGLPQIRVVDEQLSRTEGAQLLSHFGLPEGWPAVPCA